MLRAKQALCDDCERLDEEFVRVRNTYRIAALHAGLESAEARRLMELEDEATFRIIGRISDHNASRHT